MTVKKYPPQQLAALFSQWEDTMVLSCVQGVMGSIYAPDTEKPGSAAAQLKDFCFLTGKPCAQLVSFDYGRDFLIMTPENEQWSSLIEQVWGSCARRQNRYAIKKQKRFDTARLSALMDRLPEGYALHQIDEALYEACLQKDWCRDFVNAYPTFGDFQRLGLGFVVTRNGDIVSGASSYSSYRGGIEIEIGTEPSHRRKGLAAAAGAALILACLERGLYPSWDAQNKASVALAEKLGYTFSHEYPIYEVERPKG